MKDALEPLTPAAQLAYDDYPVIPIPENRRSMIQHHTREIAENSYGNPQNHLTGKLGEFAVAKYLGIGPLKQELDLSIYTDGGDGGFDLIYDGEKIEVKTVGAQTEDPALRIDHTKPLIADRYILTRQMSKTDIQLIGWAPQSTVQAARNQNDMGQYFFVDQEHLFPMR
jgi:hypothetical protein